jgi:hypothetical protein
MGKSAPTFDLASRAMSAICNYLDDGGRAAALLTSPLLARGVTPHHYTTHACNIRVCEPRSIGAIVKSEATTYAALQ